VILVDDGSRDETSNRQRAEAEVFVHARNYVMRQSENLLHRGAQSGRRHLVMLHPDTNMTDAAANVVGRSSRRSRCVLGSRLLVQRNEARHAVVEVSRNRS